MPPNGINSGHGDGLAQAATLTGAGAPPGANANDRPTRPQINPHQTAQPGASAQPGGDQPNGRGSSYPPSAS
jgi:hypothetical protein